MLSVGVEGRKGNDWFLASQRRGLSCLPQSFTRIHLFHPHTTQLIPHQPNQQLAWKGGDKKRLSDSNQVLVNSGDSRERALCQQKGTKELLISTVLDGKPKSSKRCQMSWLCQGHGHRSEGTGGRRKYSDSVFESNTVSVKPTIPSQCRPSERRSPMP
ncbi:uncharacterized protein LOC143441289 [Arvicanthis niloticus]|uniref:uncharacterized protein LOC143441289 n=1 Tax=Arvicanthis niloticus TaxID=61156 RepID=UPI00403CFCFD